MMTVARRPFWDAADQTFPPPTVVIAPQFGTRPRPPALTLSRSSGWTRPLTYSDIITSFAVAEMCGSSLRRLSSAHG